MRPSAEEAQRRVAEHRFWYHRIEVAPGVVTPGTHDSPAALAHLDALGLPRDLHGRRVLDVGCRDGFFAFALEARGAEVLGIDYAEPDETGFSIAANLLGSKVRYAVRNVYDLDPSRDGRFDLVLFLGVLYHLRNPMLALDRIRAVTHDSGMLLLESQLCTEKSLLSSSTPLMQFFPRDTLHGDPTNAWGPNPAGLRAMVEEAEFEVHDETVRGRRGYLRAEARVDAALARARELDSAAGTYRHGALGGGRD